MVIQPHRSSPAMLQPALARVRNSPALMPSSPISRSPFAHMASETRNSRPAGRSAAAASAALSASIANAIQACASSAASGSSYSICPGSRGSVCPVCRCRRAR
jgi:hypothetical protein